MKPKQSQTSRRLLLAGVACIFGGEAFCILGPLKYEVLHFRGGQSRSGQ